MGGDTPSDDEEHISEEESNNSDNNSTENSAEDDKPSVIINALLTYTQYCMSCATPDNVRKVLCSHFTIEEIIEAKNMLWNICELGELPKRANSIKRSALEAHIDDIMEQMYLIDGAQKKYVFYTDPKGIARLPKFNPENLNVVALDQRVTELADLCYTLQAQVNSHRSLSIQCNDKINDYGTVLQQHTNALRDIRGHQYPSEYVKTDVNRGPASSPVTSKSDSDSRPASPAQCAPRSLSDTLSATSDSLNVTSSSNAALYSSVTSSTKVMPLTHATASNISPSTIVAQGRPIPDTSGSPATFTFSKEMPLSFKADYQSIQQRQSTSSHTDEDDRFEKPASQKRRTKQKEYKRGKVIHGSAADAGSRFLGGAGKRHPICDLFVYHVDHSSTASDLKSYLKHRIHIDVTKIRIDVASHSDAFFKSFRIIAPIDLKDTLLTSGFWPQNVRIKEFRPPRLKKIGTSRNNAYGGGQFNRQ